MKSFYKFVIAILIAAVLFSGMGVGFGVQPAAAQAACARYHTVWWGQTLYQIGLTYGVNWVYIAQANNIPNPSRIYAGQVLCIPAAPATAPYGTGGPYCYNWPYCYGTGGPTYSVPAFTIVNVVPGSQVTIQTTNFAVGETFDVLMNYYGTLGVGGIKVASITTTAASEQFTFTIPPALASQYQIALRLQSTTTATYAYNWFNNTTGNYGTGGPVVPTVPTGPIYFGVPSFQITGISANNSVTITTYNFPANDTFNAFMGYYGTAGIGGIYVGSVNSGAGGTQTFSFTIPPQLYGQAQIAIRLESPTSRYFAYNWFWNN